MILIEGINFIANMILINAVAVSEATRVRKRILNSTETLIVGSHETHDHLTALPVILD